MIYKAFEFAATLSDVVFLVWFVPRFCKVKLFEKKKIRLIVIPVLLLVFQLLADKFFPGFDLVYSIGFIAFVFAFTLLVSTKGKKLRAVFASCIFIVVEMFVNSLVFAVLSLFIENPTIMIQGNANASRIIYLTICVVARFLVFSVVLLIFSSESGPDRKNSVFVVVYSAIIAVGLGILMDYSSSGGRNKENVVALLCVIILSTVAVFFMLWQVSKLERQKYELKSLNDRYELQQDKYSEAIGVWNNVRKVQHDVKQHLLIIDGMLRDNDTEGCRKYVSELIPDTNQMGKIICSDNVVLDYLINAKLCALDNTEVIVSGVIGDLSDISDRDLVSIFGNIIDNAIEAIDGLDEKRIELLFSRQDANRIIICKNTVGGPVLNENGGLRTTKSDPASHGLGHVIVEETVSRLGGMIDYSESGNMFTVHIILPEQDGKQ